VWDAVASIAIGILLMGIGLVVNRETQSLLLGESASPEVQAAIRDALLSTPGIAGVVDLRTIHLSPDDLVVAAGVTVDAAHVSGITQAILEAKVRAGAAVPFRTVIYLEPRGPTS
jgi:divalent metal cation (Fe/Co/Zn/Cd) transporter